MSDLASGATAASLSRPLFEASLVPSGAAGAQPSAGLQECMKLKCGDFLTACLGRRFVARVGRWLSNAARLDVANDMRTNGERLVQEIVVRNYPSDRDLVVFDIGANVGDWSAQLLARCGPFARGSCSLHAFEPVSSTAEALRRRLEGVHAGWNVVTVRKGMSERQGQCEISVVEEGCGVNSIIPEPGQKLKRTEVAELTTVDAYCAENRIPEVGLLKSDTEGHDLFVLRGARGMLEREKIAVVQFEYNHRWVWSRATLFDVFQYAGDLDYRVGKVTPRGVEFYKEWHEELEKFVEGNCLLCREDWVDAFPRISWWNA